MITRYVCIDFLALIAGACLTLAFAPFGITIFGILAPLLLLITWLHASPRRALWRGLLFGLSHFGTGLYWFYISMHRFGGANVVVATLITALLVTVLALFPALNGFILNKCCKKNNATKLLLAFPLLWVVFEILRSWIFTGFPWLIIGDSQLDTPLAGLAPIFSTYGVSLATILCSGTLAYLYFARNKQRIISLILLFSLWVTAAQLNHIQWTTATKTQSVTLIQGNIAQSIKWTPNQVQPTLNKYLTLSAPYWTHNNIVIWPEAAVPLSIPTANTLLAPIAQQARATNSTLITGIPMQNFINHDIYNSIIAIGAHEGQYLKRHLVPFGEYYPMPWLLKPIMAALKIPMSDFNTGPSQQQNIMINDISFANFICYEIAFSLEVRSQLQAANVILVVSDDAWFGQSIAAAQHLQIAQMRAKETGRYVLFSSNDGITAIIDAQGHITQRIAPYQANVLNGSFRAMNGLTPWLAW